MNTSHFLEIPPVGLFDYLRMMSHVTKTETCWLWQAYTEKGGYGVFKFRGQNYYVHRISYRYHFKVDPGKLLVLHNENCNTPNCVNPSHLHLGSQTLNMLECGRQGRSGKQGELCGRAKLRECDVLEARKRYAAGERICEIAKSYDWVTREAVELAINRKSWKHLP